MQALVRPRFFRVTACVHASQTRSNMSPLPAADCSVGAAVAALRDEQAVAVPTDTLYGLAASATSAAGIRRLYHIKGRDAAVPLAVCVADPQVRAVAASVKVWRLSQMQDVPRYARTDHLPPGLLHSLLPGPVTLVLDRLPGALSAELNPGILRIGIRVPDSPFIRGVAREFGAALALTSANISGGMSSLTVDEFRELWPQCACVFDGGQLPQDRRGSTVVDLSQPGTFLVIREGSARASVASAATAHGLRERTE